MSTAADFERGYAAAQALHGEGKFAEAEKAYRALLEVHGGNAAARETLLRALANLYWRAGELQPAVDTLAALMKLAPDNPTYYWDLATVLQAAGQPEKAADQYRRLIERRPDFAAGQFNLGILLKRALRFAEARDAYEKALSLGIADPAEVHSNLGVLFGEMRDAERARKSYEQALAIRPDYVPARFNLAGLCEDTGDRAAAIEHYERILAAEPDNADALARRAQASEPDDTLVGRLETAIGLANNDPLARESLSFALGRLHDAAGRFDAAFQAYREANDLGRQRLPAYDPERAAAGFDRLIEVFDAEWIKRHATSSDARPIFVVGMFRSGSTLVEQMLGAHPDVSAGGELDFLPWLIARDLSPYPQRAADAPAGLLAGLADEYAARVGELFPGAANVSDKRPDNFLHVGLIRALFPKARIIYTRRERLDNCLSIWFQQFGGALGYTTRLDHIAHYYAQHRRLMSHWHAVAGDAILTVDYDRLVRSPEPVVRDLIDKLGLPWDPRCLRFETAGGLVRTASAWQVREGLYTGASGRWRNYSGVIPELDRLAAQG